MTELKLLLQRGTTQKKVTVDQDIFIIGRLQECNLCLPFRGVSRSHTRFTKRKNGVWIIEDLGSKNGTILNEQPVTSPTVISHGDVIWVGDISLVVLLSIPPQVIASKYTDFSQGKTILGNVKQLQEQWIDADSKDGNISNKDKTIARLKDLVDIAKNLSGATSIEEIFSQVQQVVFRYLNSIDRLALLIDVQSCGKLVLMNAATRNVNHKQQLMADDSWISQSICQQVFAEKVAIQSADTHQDERFAEEHSVFLKGIRSAIAVPLWDENKVVGVLYADASFSSYHWVKEGSEDLSFFSTLGNLVSSSVQRWLLLEKLKSEEIIRQRLERYHSPAVVQQLIALGTLPDGRLPPKECEISILFADVVGFTPMSERFTPSEIAELLNKLFEEMLQEVFACGGTLDKYIGDCIMAFFGAPEPQADHADRAVTTAMGMLRRLENLNFNHFWQEPLQLRIAINSGKAVVGDVGSSQRVEYTALGATINLASRMEGVCNPGECVVSEQTYQLLSKPQMFQPMGKYRFKGIDRLIKVYQNRNS
ncbi:MAG: FHA domain-containing protein [Rivularia sp. T60_A2020_040]|nr:FHA domain-containing protein [Rivularia sp. T60_A2020_040]